MSLCMNASGSSKEPLHVTMDMSLYMTCLGADCRLITFALQDNMPMNGYDVRKQVSASVNMRRHLTCAKIRSMILTGILASSLSALTMLCRLSRCL